MKGESLLSWCLWLWVVVTFIGYGYQFRHLAGPVLDALTLI